jgi:hypothetical protein
MRSSTWFAENCWICIRSFTFLQVECRNVQNHEKWTRDVCRNNCSHFYGFEVLVGQDPPSECKVAGLCVILWDLPCSITFLYVPITFLCVPGRHFTLGFRGSPSPRPPAHTSTPTHPSEPGEFLSAFPLRSMRSITFRCVLFETCWNIDCISIRSCTFLHTLSLSREMRNRLPSQFACHDHVPTRSAMVFQLIRTCSFTFLCVPLRSHAFCARLLKYWCFCIRSHAFLTTVPQITTRKPKKK